MPIIEAQSLKKSYRTAAKEPGLAGTIRHFFRRTYKDVEAVKGISFSIEPGEIVGFLGPNGAGKTTTLKMLTGLIHPTSGQTQVAGYTPYRRETPFLKKITLVMGQKQQLIWDLPALDSLRINGTVYELETAEYNRRIAELSEMLQIGDKLTTPVRKLSLGERMKAELMAALLHRPEILFLDEPTLGLDVNAQSAVRDFLRDYNRRYKATILLTSHYMADITALCPRVLLIHEGNLIYDGSLDGIRERFSPFREMTVELAHAVNADELATFGEVESVEGRIAHLIIRREALTETVSLLLEAFTVQDLTITDPPIEKIIGRIFQNGSAADPAPQKGE